MDCSPPGTSIHWDSPGKNTGSGCHALFQGIFPIQGSNPGLLNCRQILYCLIYFQHHNLKVSVLQRSAFSKIQLSHLYMTNGKTKALTIWMFLGKVMSLLFNMLSRFVVAFLSRSKCLLISWLQSLSAVILKPKKVKAAIVRWLISPTLSWLIPLQFSLH